MNSYRDDIGAWVEAAKARNWVGVLPFAWRPYYEACVATMHPDFLKRVLVIDNSDLDTNIGIMRSHNRGVDRMYEEGADWLVIISAAVRFGATGGLDLVQVLADKPDYYIIHAATANVVGGRQNDGSGGGGRNGVFGWHLTAFHRRVFETVGRWDENFSPYGLDDIDLSIRIQKAFQGEKTPAGEPAWDTFPVDVTDSTMSHSIQLAKVRAPYPPRNEYFMRKWGRSGEEWQKEAYDHPFNDPTKDLKWWPTPGDPRCLNHGYWDRR